MINFYKGLSTNLPAVGSDSTSLYFTEDNLKVYKSTGNGQPLALYSDIVFIANTSGSGIQGKVYVCTGDDKLYRWNGSTFVPLSEQASTFTATSVDALENKTIDATKNTITGLTVSNLDASAVSADNTLAAPSSSKLTTETVVKAYVDGVLSSISLGDLGGDLDASQGAFPANSIKGYYYPITVAGTIDGMQLSIGDLVIARKDDASTSLAADWIKIDNTEASDILRTGNISTNTDLTVDPTKVPDRSTVKSAIDAAVEWKTF